MLHQVGWVRTCEEVRSERDQDMRQSLCRWINNNEHSRWTVHRRGKKTSCDPSQSYGSNLVTTSNAVSPRYQEGKRRHETGPSNKHIVHPATTTRVSNMRATKAEFHKEDGRKMTSGVNTQTQDAQQEQDKTPLLALCETTCPTSLQYTLTTAK